MKQIKKLPPRIGEIEGFLSEKIIEKIDELVEQVNQLTEPIENKPDDWISKLLNSEKFMKIVDETTDKMRKEKEKSIQDLNTFEKESRKPKTVSLISNQIMVTITGFHDELSPKDYLLFLYGISDGVKKEILNPRK